jgi:putative chitinase
MKKLINSIFGVFTSFDIKPFVKKDTVEEIKEPIIVIVTKPINKKMTYVERFQKENGLLVDNKIGKNTLLKMKDVFRLPSVEATAHFVGQLDHETAGFTLDRENLNYSVNGLLTVFRKYFPNEDVARSYARQPEKIANRVYANRMGNGDERSGDGWKYRGRFSIQTTGKNNYTLLSLYLKDPQVLTDPDKVIQKHYWNAAIFFFESNNLFTLTKKVDIDSITKLTRRINGGTNGISDRINKTMKYWEILK